MAELTGEVLREDGIVGLDGGGGSLNDAAVIYIDSEIASGGIRYCSGAGRGGSMPYCRSVGNSGSEHAARARTAVMARKRSLSSAAR